MSDSDIDIGSRWGPNLDKELEKANFGILCLTPDCTSSSWILYEAGALSKFVDKSRVCPYLFELQPTDIKGPLVNFQAARANKEDTLKLILTIYHASGETTLTDQRVRSIFEKFWPELEMTLATIPPQTSTNSQNKPRSSEDMVEEILKIVREQSNYISEIHNRLDTEKKRQTLNFNEMFTEATLKTPFKVEKDIKIDQDTYRITLMGNKQTDFTRAKRMLLDLEIMEEDKKPIIADNHDLLKILNDLAETHNFNGIIDSSMVWRPAE